MTISFEYESLTGTHGNEPERRLRSMTSEPTNQGLIAMQNIDRFNETAAEILAQLYAEFPRRVSIDFEELLEADDDGGIPGDDEAFVRDTASWLVDSGYIWGKVAVPRLSMATLAPKGLETLKATPSSVDTSSSIGDQLTEAASSGARGAAGRLFSEGLTILFRAGVQGAQAMGGG